MYVLLKEIELLGWMIELLKTSLDTTELLSKVAVVIYFPTRV